MIQIALVVSMLVLEGSIIAGKKLTHIWMSTMAAHTMLAISMHKM